MGSFYPSVFRLFFELFQILGGIGLVQPFLRVILVRMTVCFPYRQKVITYKPRTTILFHYRFSLLLGRVDAVFDRCANDYVDWITIAQCSNVGHPSLFYSAFHPVAEAGDFQSEELINC